MSKVEYIDASPDVPKAIGPYSHATKFGNQIWVSGNLGVDPKSGKFVSEKSDEQARQALKNILAVLKKAGTDMNSVVKTTIMIDDMSDYPSVNKVYAEFFKEPNFPARSCFAVKTLPKNAKVEIEAIAVIQKK